MKGFLLGLAVAALAFGGYIYWTKYRVPPTPRPAQSPDAAAGSGKPAVKEKKRRRRGARLARVAGNAPGADRAPSEQAWTEPEPEPVKLSAADLKPVAQGDDLSRPDVLRLDMSDDSGSRQLDQEDIDVRFRAREEAILNCIMRARPDEDTYVPGRVTVKFRIQRAGTVRGVRVEAPAILMRGGLYGCIKGVVGNIRFPASSSSQVLTYPFSLS
jgi:hypothetical protein